MQSLKSLITFVEDRSLVPSTIMVAHDHLQVQFLGIHHPFLFSMGTRYADDTYI